MPEQMDIENWDNVETISYTHPLTNELEEFHSPVQHIQHVQNLTSGDQIIHSYRSHHPVCTMINARTGNHPDDEDWYYRFLDKYNGPIVARYDRSHDGYFTAFQYRITGVVLMSFEDWKQHTLRIEGRSTSDNECYTLEEVSTFETFVQAHLRRLERLER